MSDNETAPSAGANVFDDARFYQASIKFFTRYMEEIEPKEADVKIVAEAVKALTGLNIQGLSTSHLGENDPAAKRAEQLQQRKKKT